MTDVRSATDTAADTAPATSDTTDLVNKAAELTVDEPDNALPAFKLTDLAPVLQEACARAGWDSLMPVQCSSLPYLLAGRDLMVQSRTGSGKTGTYLLPLLTRLDPRVRSVQALVLVPTRELAVQVEREAQTLFADTDLDVVAVYGGVGYGKQLDGLRKGAAVIVGTPGRVLDHLLRRTLSLEGIRSLIFDEADRMLSIGFYQDMKDIQRQLPKRPLQVTLFSATYPPYVLRLAREFMHDPQMLSLSHAQVHVAEVQHMFCECKHMDKDRALLRLIEVENPSSAIIFCNTKNNVHYVAAVLQGFGLNADELSADLTQSRREEVLERLRKGEVRFLVATDVAARGIDIPELSHVFLYEPPDDRESYIHRAGRTGRAGAAGVVISLVDLVQKMELQRIAAYFTINLTEMPTPDDQEVAHVVGGRVTTLLESRQRLSSRLEQERSRRFLDIALEMATDPEQRPLLAMLLDAAYQQAQHGLPPLASSGSNSSSGSKGSNGSGKSASNRSDSKSRTRSGSSSQQGHQEQQGQGTGQEGRRRTQAKAGAHTAHEQNRTVASHEGTSAHATSNQAAAGEGASDGTPRPRRPRRRRSSGHDTNAE